MVSLSLQSTTSQSLTSQEKVAHTLGATAFPSACRITAMVGVPVWFPLQHWVGKARHAHIPLLVCAPGRKTFPRARRTQAHGLRSPVSFSPTEQSPSTSSGSSVFTPDLEDCAGPARRPRRGSDIEANQSSTPSLSVMDISPPSRCELLLSCRKRSSSYLPP